MALSKQKIEDRLLAHHLFPRIAKRGDEFPPCFVSTEFTSKLANKLISLESNRSDGFGVMSLRATRYDLAPRNMEILHPRAYAKLVRELKTSWPQWKDVETNPSSVIRMTDHADKRIFSMIPNASVEDLMVPGGRFLAKVDITNFYGSIYTHAIPWAVHGTEKGKSAREDGSDWTNAIDSVTRLARRKETTGISVGPGTSAVIGEIMMGAVDDRLREKGHVFQRYIDDYFCVCPTRDRAEAFVRDVRDELSLLKLAVHPAKTKIMELPVPVRPRWMRELRCVSRSGMNTLGKLLDLLDHAIDSPNQVEEEGALRYALVSVERALGEDADEGTCLAVVDRLLTLGFKMPTAMGTACRILGAQEADAVAARAISLNRILREHVANRRTDAATWIIYLLLTSNVPIEPETVDEVIGSRDGLSMALLASDSQYSRAVVNFVEAFEQGQPPAYMRDEYWLVYYQLWLANRRSITASEDGYYSELQPLKDQGLSLIDLSATNPYLQSHTPETDGSGSAAVGVAFSSGGTSADL
ncbi:RNA-directed DNA polymerase [Micrococcus terreus]|uniref:RNA-directed DNA polymerase n=1 Tax=Micrococcus terreus TaxID=574650 RepID=UPI00254F512B|nr:RNA-directed DNA polymerase [Micrococcus terreus]MDK7701906.1 RNA-directed DNA polymerase [Micrococcus terreus]WOO97464.1 RNA-directed DNA polymerase [Micrococcus terreus]